MESLINQNFAYLFITAAVLLAIATMLFPRLMWLKIGMALCLLAAGYELFHLIANPWALLAAALSPFIFLIATRQSSHHNPLLLLTGVMLICGSLFMFVDKNGRPTINLMLVPLVSMFCAEFIWIAARRHARTLAGGRGENPNSYIGLIGTAFTDIEDVGMVQVDDETLPARSEQLIPAGSAVRIVKNEGRLLVVKKVEKLSSK
jgi:membrane-bound ClpP family serine protease